MESLADPKNTIAVLKKYNINFVKRFGQNFLIDRHVIDKIILAAGITKEDMVLEIGPGIGTLTQHLAEAAREVAAVEIDKKLIPILREDTLKGYPNVTVIQGDILEFDLTAFLHEKNADRPVKIVANLPYYITTPIIMGLLEKKVPAAGITVMVQKEAAVRMQASPGSKEYGAISLAVQYYAKPYLAANVPKNCFMPRPNVDSAVITLTPYAEPPVSVQDETLMFRLIRAAFNQRRKTLINGLANYDKLSYTKEALAHAVAEAGFLPSVRGEELTLAGFARLADILLERGGHCFE